MDGQKQVIVALGTNYAAEKNMAKGLELLAQLLMDMRHTTILENPPINLNTGHFLNCLAIGTTDKSARRLNIALKYIERHCGDRKDLRNKGYIAMDIDLLEYDGLRYHEDDWNRGYIQQLMKELHHQATPISDDTSNQTTI